MTNDSCAIKVDLQWINKLTKMKDSLIKEREILKQFHAEVLNAESVKGNGKVSEEIRKIIEDSDTLLRSQTLVEAQVRVMFEKYLSLTLSLESHALDPALRAKVLAMKREMPMYAAHSFWNTQHVVNFEEAKSHDRPQGPLKNLRLEDISTAPLALPEGFEWAVIDPSTKDLEEVCELLRGHYVEDEGLFRMAFSLEFLRWTLTVPGQYDDWALGIRLKETKELVAFESQTPIRMRLGDVEVDMAYLSFGTIHRKYRSKRFTPLLIQEATRRANLRSIWSILFTSAKVIPAPFSETWFYQYFLNVKKLVDVAVYLTLACAYDSASGKFFGGGDRGS
eukprot:TRINITY_DN7718_c0_g1_i8.p1 TRINITY_DN7718_c0_g1~~TRINITY_DN7718_c0_g1_i8.p1  ORF type:complete len:336 (+),score=56.10 TRINITY_DN7718_c0_g1_i8:109-1116(+)